MIKKPGILSDEELEVAVNQWKNGDWATRYIRLNRGHYEDILPIIAKAQNDYCYKEMCKQLKKIIGSLNMRDVGGIEPEWAMSNKDYQALQSQLEKDSL